MSQGRSLTIYEGDVNVRDLVLGFLRAYYRFEAENRRSRDPEQEAGARRLGRMALFETLNWADSVDQFLTHGPPNRGGDPKWLENLKTPEIYVVRGIRHARNVVHHQWWAAISIHIVLPTSERNQVNTWIWSELPPNNRNKKSQAAYENSLLGRPVEDALGILRDVLWKRRRWQISAADLAQPSYPPPGAPTD